MATITEKYSPKTLDDVVTQKHVITILRSYLQAGGGLPHLLFTGGPGTCKTTTIHALARDLYGVDDIKTMMLELNGSDDRGISVIRTQIKNFSRLKNMSHPDKPRIILLDEADSMTYDAQSALRRVMEKHTGNVRFCLICNYINKLIPALQSRCTIFRFGAIQFSEVESSLTRICQLEGIQIDRELLLDVVEWSKGDLRRCLNFLDSHRTVRKIERDHLPKYFFGLDQAGMQRVNDLLLSRHGSMTQIYDKLIKIRDDYHLSLENFLDVITHVSLQNKQYSFLTQIADIEYFFFKSRHTFENIFFRAIAAAIISQGS